MLLIVVSVLVFQIFAQEALGSFIGIQSIWDEQKQIFGIALSLYNLAYNPVLINDSATIWSKTGEQFFDETCVTLDKKNGFAYATVIIKDTDWNFKSQSLQTWQYKRNGEYILPELQNSLEIAKSSGNRILALYWSSKESTLYSVFGNPTGGIDVAQLDPKTGRKKVIIHTDGIFPGYGGSSFDETSATIAYPSGKNTFRFINLQKFSTYKLEVTPNTTTTDGMICQSDGSRTCIGTGYYVPTPHEPAIHYTFKILLGDTSASYDIVPNTYGPGLLGTYKGELVDIFADDTHMRYTIVALDWGTLHRVVEIDMDGTKRPEFGYDYDHQVKVY